MEDRNGSEIFTVYICVCLCVYPNIYPLIYPSDHDTRLKIVFKKVNDFLKSIYSFFFIVAFYKNNFFFSLVALGVPCYVQAFSGCSKWGLLVTVVHGLAIVAASLVAGHRS